MNASLLRFAFVNRPALLGLLEQCERALGSSVSFVETNAPKVAAASESMARQTVKRTGSTIRWSALKCVPAINLLERILFPRKTPSLRTSALLHFNQNATCFFRG